MYQMNEKVYLSCKKAWGNICLNLHSIKTIWVWSWSRSSSRYVLEHTSNRKNADKSITGLTTLVGREWRNVNGIIYCMSIWLTCLFKPTMVRSLSFTQHDTFEAYLLGTLTSLITFKKEYLSALDIVKQAGVGMPCLLEFVLQKKKDEVNILPSTTI